MRTLKRKNTPQADVAMIPIRLSAKDKNLVALYWLLEITLTALTGMDDNLKPAGKKEMYKALTTDLLGNVQAVSKAVNDRFSNQINKVFGIDYQDTLADTCVAVVTLFETMPPESVKKVIQAAGISDEMIIKNWNT